MIRTALVAAAALAALLGQQQPPPIRVAVRMVNLPVLVFSRDNKLVPGLDADSFRVLDEGHPQRVTLDTAVAPLSVAVAVQANRDVRQYVPFIAKTGSTVEALLAGATGETAIITYGDDVRVAKPFASGDLATAMRSLRMDARSVRMFDAGMRGVALLAERPRARARVLLFIGQARDAGSESTLAALEEAAAREGVSVFALSLPVLDQAFISDTFWLKGLTFERGGFRAGADLGHLITVLNRSGKAGTGDPAAVLAGATGGAQFHVRTQREVEDGLAAVGFEVRSAYTLSYYPSPAAAGYHSVTVEVAVPGARVYAKPGYWLTAEEPR